MSAKVSIIVSICDGESHLKEALISIKNQTFKDIEVLMYNTGSVDNTESIMLEFCSDKRFSYYELKEKSVSCGRNKALEMASGKYVAFCDENVIFSKDYIESMFNSAEKENADLCVCQMASSDAYGEHEFSSSRVLSRNKKTSKFDMNLIWNPAVTNKLFLKEKIDNCGFKFHLYGKGREVAFSLPFAYKCKVISCPKKGLVTYISPVYSKETTYFNIDYYIQSYDYVRSCATEAFDKEIKNSVSDFDKAELIKEKTCYIDELYSKQITVILYSYYRHFWRLTDEQILTFTNIIRGLYSKVSRNGQLILKKRNNDIFYDKDLIDNRKEMAERAKITVCVSTSDKFHQITKEELYEQIRAIFHQTMPCFKVVVDSRLKNIFPEKYLQYPNLSFLSSNSLSDFKQKALDNCDTSYIMYHDFFTIISNKLLMYHYREIHGKQKYGFTTSPISMYSNKIVKRYTFSKLSFKYNKKSTHAHNDDMHALDLFFCNKLFRVNHLKGIKFEFSENSIIDMYSIYSNSRFKKMSSSGVYLTQSEDRVVSAFKSEQKFLPQYCNRLYMNYKSIYFRKYSVKTRVEKLLSKFIGIKSYLISFMNVFLTGVYSKRNLKNQVFIYSNRNDYLIENLAKIDNHLNCNKVVFSKRFPHSIKDKAKIKKHLLTSKVIVIDENMKYLRRERLRKDQKVIQAWYTSGAFKRFGLDAPLNISRFDEYKSHSQYTDVCVSSEYVKQFYAHAFGIGIEKIKATGTPRSDDILNKDLYKNNRNSIVEKHPLLKEKKVYVYFPTIREHDGEIVDFDTKIDWVDLNDKLDDDEVLIIYRHTLMQSREFIKGEFYSRVKDYTFEPIAEILAVADVIVTDYSSVIFEAALLDLPMVFYCPDFDTYERDFYLDYENELPGEIINDYSNLLNTIRSAANETDKEKITAFKKNQMGACDGNSTKRIVDIIESYLQ